MEQQVNETLKRVIMDVLDNQLESGDPPETKQTYDRLLGNGIDKKETRRLIACVIAGEIFDIMKEQKPFDQERFAKRLADLPETPWLN